MHSEPSKAAMERAIDATQELHGCGVPGAQSTLSAFARYIDTVDRVAREVLGWAEYEVCGGLPPELTALRTIMLPDEPDADAVNPLIHEVGDLIRNDPSKPWFEHLKVAAAGYTITKEPTV